MDAVTIRVTDLRLNSAGRRLHRQYVLLCRAVGATPVEIAQNRRVDQLEALYDAYVDARKATAERAA
jgi:hypothetical protein